MTCARCDELTPKSTTKYRFPEGLICGRCYDRAVHTHGRCNECRTIRLLPGVNSAHDPICVTCAGIDRDFHCARCSTEAAIFRAGLCERCALADDLEELLRAPDDHAHPDLTPLRHHLLAADRPTSVLTWLRSNKVVDLLSGIADGRISTDHEALDALPQDGAIRHLRALLVESGLLELRDESFVRFETWARNAVAQTIGEDRRALERYVLWRHLRRIRQLHSVGTDVHSAAHSAKQQITAARELLAWLAERDTLLANCTQSDIDIWLTTGPTSRYTIRGFIQFTTDSRLSPPLLVPTRHARARTRRITDDERLRWIRYYLITPALTASTRTAALMLLVFGQPLTRIAAMQVDAVMDDPETGLTIRFATDPISVPHPFDDIVRTHLSDRSRTRTKFAAQNPFLFPGMRAGAHITREQLKNELNTMGVDILAAKNTTLDELVAEMPGPLVAEALGYSNTAMGQHEQYRGVRYRGYVGSRLVED